MAKYSSVLILLLLLLVGGLQLCFCKNSTFGCIESEREALLQLKKSFHDPSNLLVSWTGTDCCLWNGVSCNQITGHVVKLDLRAPTISYFQWEYDFVYAYTFKQLFATEFSSCLVDLKRLEYLDLSGNNFNQSLIPKFFGSLKHLKYLNLSRAVFGGRIPTQLGNLTNLQILDLSDNLEMSYVDSALYVDNFQWVLGLSSLKHLEMSYVNLSKALDVMRVLNTLPSLIHLGLNDCGIQNIHFPHGSLNSTFLTSVQFLSLAGNSLSAPIPNVVQNMTSLRELDLSYQGDYYSDGFYVDNLQWFSRLSSLQHLDMSGLNLAKALDLMQVLNKLPSLIYLGLNFCGIQNIHFPRGFLNSTFLKSVQFLHLRGNSLTGSVPNALQNMTALGELDLGYQRGFYSGGLSFDTIQSLSRLSSLQHLDMSFTNLSKAIDMMQVLNTLPSLQELRLRCCGIQNIHFPRGLINSTFSVRIQFLDLQSNELRGPIPGALHNMTAVRLLDLSRNRFNSTIPLSLVNSKSLVDLYLGWNEFENIEGGMLSMLNKACSLRSLEISRNSFLGDVFGSNKNSSRCLVYHLEDLSLGDGGISGDLPDYLGRLKGLKQLDLARNSLYGPIPSSLGELSELSSLDLSNNQLNGIIPQSLGKLSSLDSLDLSNNQLNGIIPQSLGKLLRLYSLDLSNNQLNGIIPQSLGKLSSLRWLNLSHNQLSGYVPKSLGQLENLWAFDISSNSLQGNITELNFANLSNINVLDISSNHLIFNVKSDWVPPFSLLYVNMSSCEIGSQFPRWIQTQNYVKVLDFSNTNISGGFPVNIADKMPALKTLRLRNNLMNGQLSDSLCKLKFLEAVDLSRNRLSGEMPQCWGASSSLHNRSAPFFRQMFYGRRIYLINLSSNKLSGTLPNSIGHLTFLKRLHVDKNHLSGELPLALRNCKELEIMDLGENKFFGSIPSWIGESLSSLRILRLRNNMFNGSIPPQLCQLSELQILSLGHNNLRGRIPHCFGNFTGMIKERFSSLTSKKENNVTVSTFSPPPAFPKDDDTSWSKEKIQEVNNGIDLEYTKMVLQLLDFMDLSSNKLDGVIPEDLCRLIGLRGLNLSHNRFLGSIPNRIGELKLLETLDLSNNDLSGSIPSSMSALQSISHLNLSHNMLSGKIPTSSQLQTLDDPSIYAGNLQLCGYPLPKCHDDSVQPPTSTIHEDEDHEEDKKEKILFYFIVFVGYATGLWGVIGTLVLKRNWRLAYFCFVDNIKDRIFVAVVVEVARLKKRIQRTDTEE